MFYELSYFPALLPHDITWEALCHVFVYRPPGPTGFKGSKAEPILTLFHPHLTHTWA